MAEHYYTVGVHGAPTPETAPHGFAWIGVADHRWRFASAGHDVHANSTKWYPLPPPPTEQAPAPEPVADNCCPSPLHRDGWVTADEIEEVPDAPDN